MPPSKTKSLRNLNTYILPRRTHDRASEKAYYDAHKKETSMFRRVAPDEKDRGEQYTVFNAGINTFAHFGIGVGIYFLQLLILCSVFFVSGMIMLAAVDAYKNTDYGLTRDDPLMTISAACAGVVNVTATIGCDEGEDSCLIGKRENCNLPVHAAFADLVMSLFFMLFRNATGRGDSNCSRLFRGSF